MPINISNAFSLIQSGISIPSSSAFTYKIASSSPSYWTTLPTIFGNYKTSPNDSIADYTLTSSDFVDISSIAGYSSSTIQSLSAFSNISGATFNNSSSSSADIIISGLNTDLYYKNSPGNYTESAGVTFGGTFGNAYNYDVFLTSSRPTDAYGQMRLMQHELSHAIGLKDTNTISGFSAAENNGRYTIMSYEPHPGTGLEVGELQIYDIAAIQSIYGRNDNYNSSNNIYNDFIVSYNTTEYDRAYSIWDGGGVDTVDSSNHESAAFIDLRPGSFSSIGDRSAVSTDTTNASLSNSGSLNISIAFGAYIENAIGTDYNDFIIGNTISNEISGGQGNDIIYSDGIYSSHEQGSGDYRQISSTSSNHFADAPSTIGEFLSGTKQSDVVHGNDGNDLIFGGPGNDTLYGDGGNDLIRDWSTRSYSNPGNKNIIDGGIGDDIIITGNAEIYGGVGADQFWFESNSSPVASLDIFDADADDTIYWYGHQITGGAAHFLDLEFEADYTPDFRAGWIDGNNVAYSWSGDMLQIFLPGENGIINIHDFDSGDAGIYLDKNDIIGAYVTQSFDEDGNMISWDTSIPVSEVAMNEIFWEHSMYSMPSYGSLATPTTFLPVV